MIYQTALGTYIDLSKITFIGPIVDRVGGEYIVSLQLSEAMAVSKFSFERAFHEQIADELADETKRVVEGGASMSAVMDNFDGRVRALFEQSRTDLLAAWEAYKASRAARLDALLARLEGSSDKDAVALINALG